MGVKTFTFCDICNPDCRIATSDRRESRRDGNAGRRSSDTCSWFEGVPDDSAEEGWILTSRGKHICPSCYVQHRDAVFSF